MESQWMQQAYIRYDNKKEHLIKWGSIHVTLVTEMLHFLVFLRHEKPKFSHIYTTVMRVWGTTYQQMREEAIQADNQ